MRNSEVWAFKRCRLRWYWGWVLKLQPSVTLPALRFGSLVHGALEKYYKPGRKRGPHPAGTFTKLYDRELEEHARFGVRDNEQWVAAGELGPDLLESYVDYWKESHGGQPADKYLEIIAPEMPFRVRLRHTDIVAIGKLDAPYRDHRNGRIGIIDHKTAKSIRTRGYNLNEQGSHYWTFAPSFFHAKGILKPKQRLSVILFNFLRKAKRDPRPQDKSGAYLNQDGSVSKRQPSPIFARHPVWRDEGDRKELRTRLIDTVHEMELARAGRLRIYKSPQHDCDSCPFLDPCELHESGADYEEMLNLAYEPWDPYAYAEAMRKG